MNKFLQSFSSLSLNHSRRVVVSNKRKYAHKILVLIACPSLLRKSVVRWTRPLPSIIFLYFFTILQAFS